MAISLDEKQDVLLVPRLSVAVAERDVEQFVWCDECSESQVVECVEGT